MAQILIAVVLTVVVVGFAMSNSHHVELGYGFGEPIKIRLIFLLTITFFGGVVFGWFWQMFSKVKRQRIERQSMAPRAAHIAPEVDE